MVFQGQYKAATPSAHEAQAPGALGFRFLDPTAGWRNNLAPRHKAFAAIDFISTCPKEGSLPLLHCSQYPCRRLSDQQVMNQLRSFSCLNGDEPSRRRDKPTLARQTCPDCFRRHNWISSHLAHLTHWSFGGFEQTGFDSLVILITCICGSKEMLGFLETYNSKDQGMRWWTLFWKS